MQEDGAAVARNLASAYDRNDPRAVMREINTLFTRLLPWKLDFWTDDRTKAPILMPSGELPTLEEFLLMSATNSHGRVDPNELHATANAIKNNRRNRIGRL
jgi:hypothetical protein